MVISITSMLALNGSSALFIKGNFAVTIPEEHINSYRRTSI